MFAVSKLSCFLDLYCEEHWRAALCVVWYLKGTCDIHLVWGGKDQEVWAILILTQDPWGGVPLAVTVFWTTPNLGIQALPNRLLGYILYWKIKGETIVGIASDLCVTAEGKRTSSPP